MQPWEHASLFVELALSIDQHFPGYVDAYFGPQEIPQALERRGKAPLQDLEQAAGQLLAFLAKDEALASARREYLQGEVGAMGVTLRLLQGESMEFREEVHSLYGITPTWTEEAVFEEAHAALDALLPGNDPLPERLQAFRESLEVSAQSAAPLIEHLAGQLRARTLQRFPLPEQEGCAFEFVQDQPWGAYNWYLGQYRSRIDFNLDFPIRTYTLPGFIAHESYPGHHTEHSLKEQRLYRQGGLLEHAVLLSNTPSAVISEGIAVHALEMVYSPEELVDLYQHILAETGQTSYKGRLLYEFMHVAGQPLRKVGNNQLLLLHEKGASDEEVIAYGMRYALTTQEVESKAIRFAKDPLWHSYGFNYTVGYDLIANLLASAVDRDRMFAQLLQEPITPAQMVQLAGG